VLAIDPLARSSTYEDLWMGRKTEVDYINGEIVRMAERLGRPAPANARIIELIRAAGAGVRKRFGGAELLRELRRAVVHQLSSR
jgi:2-dehydropantoate 2-reductase